MFAGLKTGNNLSLYAVPAAYVLGLAPHFYAIALLNLKKAPGARGFDFSNPHNMAEIVAESKLSAKDQDHYNRAESASQNCLGSVGLFAASIVIGNYARLPTPLLNRVAGIYLAGRTAFTFMYILGTNNAAGIARMAIWLAGSFTALSLWVEAGDKMNSLLPA